MQVLVQLCMALTSLSACTGRTFVAETHSWLDWNLRFNCSTTVDCMSEATTSRTRDFTHWSLEFVEQLGNRSLHQGIMVENMINCGAIHICIRGNVCCALQLAGSSDILCRLMLIFWLKIYTYIWSQKQWQVPRMTSFGTRLVTIQIF